MQTYSFGVALFDYLPVAVTAVALAFLARAISQRHRALAAVAWSAALLIPFGGVCKASWKLIIATQQQDIVWLANVLFIAMAPGFIAMAFSLRHARLAWQRGTAAGTATYSRNWLALLLIAPLLAGLAAAWWAPETRLWFFSLLAITTVANAALIVQALLACKRGGLVWPAACFALNFAATLILSGLSRLPASEATAWLQEAVNLFAQSALALGAWRLARRMQEPV